MNRQFKKTGQRKLPLDLKKSTKCDKKRLETSTILLSIVAVLLLFGQGCVPKPAASTKKIPDPNKPPALIEQALKETPATKKPTPVETPKVILRSLIAGSWYPADAESLTSQIDNFFRKTQTKPTDNVIALILPHAGYQYSGQTAAAGLKSTNKKYTRIVVIGPSHTIPMEEILSVPRATHFQTPLGQIPLDTEFIDKLLEHPVFQNAPMVLEHEHSVQIQLPLLQYCRKDFKVVPIVAGSCSPEIIDKAGTILKSLVDDQTLVVASSDFVHYGPNYDYVPFRNNIPEQIKKLDMGAYEYIAKLDGKGFADYRHTTGATICGYVPITILLSMLPDSAQAHLISQTSSGELSGNFTNSVSYLSIAFSGNWQQGAKIKEEKQNTELSETDKKELLKLARRTLIFYLTKQQVPEPSQLDITITSAMRYPRAAFVTLKKNSDLRGCIGDVYPRQPLYKSVISNAINAAVNDWRFYPVTKSECNDITIEISAMTVPQPISSPDKIKIGTDGVILKKQGKSALFLPQVAPEQGWNLDQMFTQLSLKADLPPDAWKEGAEFMVFQAVVFGEEK